MSHYRSSSKNEQVEELPSMLEMKEERMKVLESQAKDKKKILLEGKCTITRYYYYNDIDYVI